jgi:type I restriction-modification system DNA methylase subunit/predicted type IV restriction endonuclease
MSTPAPDSVRRLVDHFDQNRAAYLSGSYNEAQLRHEFLGPFFEALGWDVYNHQGSAMPYRDVIFEDSLKVGGASKAPDYCFRIGGMRKFFVEAKKPSVNIATGAGPAFQLRRYAWSAKLPLSILTDFEEFAVYDCRSRPVRTDKASTARIKLLRYSEYPDRWDELSSVFSPEAIRKGSFDKYVEDTKVRKGTAEVDDAFLAEIEGWRDSLARNIALRNPRLGTPDNTADLNLAVQMTIDRAIFLRICEDRGIEDYGTLQNLIGKPGVYRRLMERFEDADKRYNSGLFDFRKDTVTPSLKIDDKLLSDILSELYPPKSPYEFSVIGIEILGEVYEQFLGKVIRLTAGHQAKVEEKPEVRKAGGVRYTPQYIVRYLVKNTIGKLIAGKTPAEISKLAFIDMSCGSGSFAIGGYSYLLDYHLDWYVKHDPAKRPNEVFAIRPGEYLLTTAEKKRILLNNIYGVDIDPQAVEVTKLSLLLKVLEGENRETINSQLKLYHERALPNLDSNIKCGNSLIDSDFYRGQQGGLFDADIRRVNAFDWHKAFPEVMARGGFDAVIGNPPYVRSQSLGEEMRDYYGRHYAAATKTYDIYVLFVERALSLLNSNGKVGLILPNKFFTTDYGEGLRRILGERKAIERLVDFEDAQIFEGAGTYTTLLFLSGTPTQDTQYVALGEAFRKGGTRGIEVALSASELRFNQLRVTSDGSRWTLASGARGQVLSRLQAAFPQLSSLEPHIFQGLKTSADGIYMVRLHRTKGKIAVVTNMQNEEFRVEVGVLKPVLKGEHVQRYSIDSTAHLHIIYPYAQGSDGRASVLAADVFERDFPLAFKYLQGKRDVLGARDRGEWRRRKDWYAYARSQNIATFLGRKFLLPYMTSRLRVADDAKGTYFFVNITTGGYGLRVDLGQHSHEYLLATLNSRLMDYCIRLMTNMFRGGYFAVNKQSLERLPFRAIDFSNKADKARHDKMVELVTRMMELKKQQARAPKKQSPSAKQLLDQKLAITDHQIDALVYELYGLSDEEIGIVEGATEQ